MYGEALEQILASKESECTTKMASADPGYCNQQTTEENECEAYETCRNTATSGWEAAKLRGRKGQMKAHAPRAERYPPAKQAWSCHYREGCARH